MPLENPRALFLCDFEYSCCSCREIGEKCLLPLEKSVGLILQMVNPPKAAQIKIIGREEHLAA